MSWEDLVATKTLIEPGVWETSNDAEVELNDIDLEDDTVQLTIDSNWFDADGLRELAEFANELADQLEQ